MPTESNIQQVIDDFQRRVREERGIYEFDMRRSEYIAASFAAILASTGITGIGSLLTKGHESPPALVIQATHPDHGPVVLNVSMETRHSQIQQILAERGVGAPFLAAGKDQGRVKWIMTRDIETADFRPENRHNTNGVSFNELQSLMPRIASLINRYQSELNQISTTDPKKIPRNTPAVSSIFLAQVAAVVEKALEPHGFLDAHEDYHGNSTHIAANLLIKLAQRAYSTDSIVYLHGDPWQGSLHMQINNPESLTLDGPAFFRGPKELDLTHFITRIAQNGDEVAALVKALHNAKVPDTDSPKFFELLAVGCLRRAGEEQLVLRERLGLSEGDHFDPRNPTAEQSARLKEKGVDLKEVNNKTESLLDAAFNYWSQARGKGSAFKAGVVNTEVPGQVLNGRADLTTTPGTAPAVRSDPLPHHDLGR